MTTRVTRLDISVSYTPTADTRVTHLYIQSLAVPEANTRVTHLYIQVFISNSSPPIDEDLGCICSGLSSLNVDCIGPLTSQYSACGGLSAAIASASELGAESPMGAIDVTSDAVARSCITADGSICFDVVGPPGPDTPGSAIGAGGITQIHVQMLRARL